MLEAERDVLSRILLAVALDYRGQVCHQLSRPELQPEASRVEAPEVEELVHKREDALRVAVHYLVVALARRVVIRLDKFLQRIDYQRQGTLYLMVDIHEELQLEVVYLLRMAVLAQLLLCKVMAFLPIVEQQDHAEQQQAVQDFRGSARPERGVDVDPELQCVGLDEVVPRLELQQVLLRRKAAERHAPESLGKGHPVRTVEPVEELQAAGRVMFSRREEQSEGVVLLEEVDLVLGIYRSVYDIVTARLHPACHRAVVEQETGYTHGPFLRRAGNLPRCEIGYSVGPSEPEGSVGIFPTHVLVELPAVHAVIGGVRVQKAIFTGHPRKSLPRGEPGDSGIVLQNRIHLVAEAAGTVRNQPASSGRRP